MRGNVATSLSAMISTGLQVPFDHELVIARPGPRTGIDGLALAGAFTDTGWPATMEGAVRSGHAAADVALASLGSERAIVEVAP